MEECIRFEGVCKSYGKHTVLQDFNLTVYSGEFLTMIGRSGCGKTTALRLINGLLTPDAGRVLVDGKDVAQTDLIELRRGIGYAIQSVGLFPHMTVEKNIIYVPSLSGKQSRETRAKRVSELLETVGLNPSLADRYPNELSGGQQQRVSIARTLVTNPEIILFDEPMSALDVETRLSMREELKRIQRESGTTMIYITHDQEEAFALSDRIMVMGRGRIHQLDTPETIISSPADDYVNDFVNRNLRIKMDSLARFMGN